MIMEAVSVEAVTRGCSVKKGVLKNFANFTSLTRKSFLPATLVKKRSWHRCFLETCEIFNDIFSYETSLMALSVHIPILTVTCVVKCTVG